MTGREPQGLICIGSSAGGLRSIRALLAGLPPGLAWPVLVTQHMQSDQESQLTPLLAASTKLRVEEARDGDDPVAGHVYVCPASHELGVAPDGRLALRPPAAGRPQRVDHLFSTASFASPLVVAVVLSGTGTDGAGGALVVKMNGGTVLAESGQSAQHPGMPDAARQAGAVDSELPAADMGAVLAALAEGGLREDTQRVERTLRRIAATLEAHTGTAFAGYRLATLRRRAYKRRALTGAPDLEAYADLVERDADERSALVQSLLIPVTEFFRDPASWEGLARDVLPALAQRADSGERVRIWCAGCATGEEAYTLAILLSERMVEPGAVEILATDLDAGSLEHARRGVYPPSRLREVSLDRIERFFTPAGEDYAVRDEVRGIVTFVQQDLTRELPPGPFDLIVCRNVLIYFGEALQASVLDRFQSVLSPEGYLFLGRSEAVPFDDARFVTNATAGRLFRPKARVPGPGAADVPPILLEDSDALLLVVDAQWRVRAANARAKRRFGNVAPGTSLLEMLPSWADSPVREALMKSLATGRSVRVLGAPTGTGPLDVTIEPFGPDSGTLLVVAHAPEDGDSLDIERRADLAATNDELQAVNEELASANEELQASNEELASLNEEFQSTNENLAATNAELRASAQLERNVYLRALLISQPEALILCDAEGRVILANAGAQSLLGAEALAPGRPPDLGAHGIGPDVLSGWLSASAATATRADRVSTTLRVSILPLADGPRLLGWLLTCAP